MIYHLLPEFEPFSSFRGGAVARNVAKMMVYDNGCVVCSSQDQSWGFDGNRVIVLDALRSFVKLRGRRYLPVEVTGPFFRRVFAGLLSSLVAGDIVHCHSQPDYCVALERLIHGKGAKLIFHSHSPLAFYGRRPHFRLFRADAYIFVSDAMKREALSLFPSLRNTYVVHNGADEELFFPERPAQKRKGKFVVLFAGRVHQTKGVHVLMEAMRILEQRGCDVCCKVVGSSFAGDAKASRYMKQMVKRKPDNVRFLGFCAPFELAREYREADVLCFPSIWPEPFGNVLVEAMASGLPVVATHVGGVPEVASGGGFLLVRPNDPEEIADALQWLLLDERLRLLLANQARQSFLRRFPWSTICAQYRRIVQAILSEPGAIPAILPMQKR